MTTKSLTQQRLGSLFFYGMAILVVYLAYLVFRPFLVPLAWATVLVVVTYPVYEGLSNRYGRNPSALLSAIAVTLLIVVPAILVLIAFAQQAVEAVHSVQSGVAAGHYAWVNRAYSKLHERFPESPADLGGLIRNYTAVAAGYIAARIGSILKNTADFVLDASFTMLAMFYFFRDGKAIIARLTRSLPFEEGDQSRVIGNTRDLMHATVISSLVAAAVHGLVGGIAFALTGIKAPVFWGVLMAFFSLIPLIGTALVWVPLSIGLIIGGHLGRGIALIVVCSVVLGMIDNFVRPLLISGRAKMSTLLIFIGVLGGVGVFGILGVVVGPIVIAMAATLLDFYAPAHGAKVAGKPVKADEKAKQTVLE